MVRDIALRATAWIELGEPAADVAQQPSYLGPFRRFVGLAQDQLERVGDRALLDDHRAIHVAFAEFQLGIAQDIPFGLAAREADRQRLSGPIAKGKRRATRGGDPEITAPNEMTQ